MIPIAGNITHKTRLGKEDLSHGWNAFQKENTYSNSYGPSTSLPPDRVRLSRGNERSIVAPLYTRLAIDISSNPIHHVRVNENDQYLETIHDGLDYALSKSANLDQTGTALILDAAMSMFDEGYIAIVPIDTTINPTVSGSYDIQTLRIGQILEWYPSYVKVRAYNQITGKKEDIFCPKASTAIIENPLYSIMNEPNSTLQRLIRKLNLLDVIDERVGADKLDLLIQLPYVIKSNSRMEMAEKRKKQLEEQLSTSKFGIGYIDATERITQLNRPVDNSLMSQIEYLTTSLYNQLGITASVFDGTADEATMLNYYNRSVAPVLNAFTEEMSRKFLTKTATTQNQKIMWLSTPFKLVPAEKLAEIADKFTRNKILTSNEFRGVIGYKPSDDPSADKLENSNLNQPIEEAGVEDAEVDQLIEELEREETDNA